jgi:hypothetical protein
LSDAVVIAGDKEMDDFGDAARRHIKLEYLTNLAHFIAGLFNGLFANTDFRFIVVQQAGAGFNQRPSSLPLTQVATRNWRIRTTLFLSGLYSRMVAPFPRRKPRVYGESRHHFYGSNRR